MDIMRIGHEADWIELALEITVVQVQPFMTVMKFLVL
jgi:hypothetical protein